MAQAIFAITIGLTIIILLLLLLLFLRWFGADRAARRQRNRMYPVRLFQYAYQIPELKQYLVELADECVAILFPPRRNHSAGDHTIARDALDRI